MGLVLSVIITYAGFNKAIQCLKHIIRGIVPSTEPNFQDLVDYYTRPLRKAANPSSTRDWTTECGQGYLYLTENKDGRIKSAAIRYYGDRSGSTALLFSTKISSFGQDSIEENQANGDQNVERSKTKTIISKSSESFSVGNKKLSLTSSVNDLQETNPRNASEDNKDKLTWEYIPKSTSPLPEINFQSYDDDKIGDAAYSDNYLRSLDGIKCKPLQRNDPSGRRRSFRKRQSSSSNSSRESRASREEELKMFTSLEEEEFKRMSGENNYTGFGSAPNLAARSHSRSRSRERSKDEPPNGAIPLEVTPQRSLSRLGSFEERDEIKVNEVIEEAPEVDFWSNLAD